VRKSASKPNGESLKRKIVQNKTAAFPKGKTAVFGF